MSDDEIKEIVEDEFSNKREIPYVYKADERKMLVAVRLLTDWYALTSAHFSTEFEKCVFDMLVDCLAEMASADGIQTYKGSSISYAKVIDKINTIVKRDGSLFDFVHETIDDYIQAAKKNEIKDKCQYMKSVIWNSFLTYQVKFESNFARIFNHE